MPLAPPVDKRALMQAAAAQQPQGAQQPQPMPQGAPPGMPPSGAPQPGGPPQPGPQPGAPGAAGPPLNQTQIANVVGSGVDLSQDPSAITGMVQMLQDPGLPPDQKAEIQMRLQLAALSSLQGSGGSPGGAAPGGPGGQ